MPTLTSLLSSQIATDTENTSQEIELVEIKILFHPRGGRIQLTYINKHNVISEIHISSLPDPNKALTAISNCIRIATSAMTIPNNCTITEILFVLTDSTPNQIELSFEFNISLPTQKLAVTINERFVSSVVPLSEDTQLTNLRLSFSNIHSNRMSILTEDTTLYDNPPESPYLNLRMRQEVTTDTDIELGSATPTWKWGKYTIDYPAYRIEYLTPSTQQTLYTTLQKRLQYILSRLNLPPRYNIDIDTLFFTTGQSTGLLRTKVVAPMENYTN